MMQHSFNRFLPNDMDWRDLFEMVRECYQFFNFIKLNYLLQIVKHIFLEVIYFFAFHFQMDECSFTGYRFCKEARIFSNVTSII